MIRKTLTFFSLFGLLLSVGLWGASYVGYFYGVIVDDYEVLVWAGDCRFRHKPPPYAWVPRVKADAESTVYFQPIEPLTLLSERIDKRPKRMLFGGSLGPPATVVTHSVPLWLPSVLFLVLALSCVGPPAYRRRKRKKLGLCLKCGYDLRGSKDRCPECGTTVETP